jgi:hypothetical protein
MHIDLTFFMNMGHDLPYSKQLNMTDPNLSYTYKSALNATVANPFYLYSTPEKFPGALRNRPTVTIGSLLSPYPQYGGLTETNVPGRLNRYYALQMRIERRFSAGYTFVNAYNYNREYNSEFFNSDDEYAGKFTMIGGNAPRHRLATGGTYEFPFGEGRRFLGNVHPVVNGILGGWQTSGLFMINSGDFLRFGNLIADSSSPKLDNRTRDRWFDTSRFRNKTGDAVYTPRTNPWQYDDLTGPRYWNLDMALSKYFSVSERFKLEVKFEAYNVTNSFIPANPILTVTSSSFGKSIDQMYPNRGREMQYTMRVHF